jgi:hypothetical protein
MSTHLEVLVACGIMHRVLEQLAGHKDIMRVQD